MNKSTRKYNESDYDVNNGITKEIETLAWTEKITVINLSKKNISNLDEKVKFPPMLIDLNIAYNKLTEIPDAILNLSSLKVLDISNNMIEKFDTKPNFCSSIEQLILANNMLHGPPHWVWSESPSKLTLLDLSGNVHLNSEENECLEELLQYNTVVTELKIYNCRIRKNLELIRTFPNLKVLEFGSTQLSCFSSNCLEQFPCSNFKQCCDIIRLNLSSIQLYHINSSIDTFKNLIEINLAQNYLDSLPNEFCCLENLEICILSFNKILYLPEHIVKLKKLVLLHIDSNALCMVPEHLCALPNLKVLDLYDNNLHEIPDGIWSIPELDVAQNYLEEPEDGEYLEKKEKLRLNVSNRMNGRKPDEIPHPESVYSSDATDDEELVSYINNMSRDDDQQEARSMSTPEDWDSDEYWTPGMYRSKTPPWEPLWMYFIKQKMGEGNFCPMDMHTESVSEKVKNELKKSKLCYEVEGQFDDYSEDDT